MTLRGRGDALYSLSKVEEVQTTAYAVFVNSLLKSYAMDSYIAEADVSVCVMDGDSERNLSRVCGCLED